MLVSTYIVERGLILEPQEVDAKTAGDKSTTRVNSETGSNWSCFCFLMPSIPKKNL